MSVAAINRKGRAGWLMEQCTGRSSGWGTFQESPLRPGGLRVVAPRIWQLDASRYAPRGAPSQPRFEVVAPCFLVTAANSSPPTPSVRLKRCIFNARPERLQVIYWAYACVIITFIITAAVRPACTRHRPSWLVGPPWLIDNMSLSRPAYRWFLERGMLNS